MTNSLKHIELRIKSLERQLAAFENKRIISQDENNPFFIHKQQLIEQLKITKAKLDAEQKRQRSKIEQKKQSESKNIESPQTKIKRLLKNLNQEIESVKHEIKQADNQKKTLLKTALKAMQKQKDALLEKQKFISELDKKEEVNKNKILTFTKTTKGKKKKTIITVTKTPNIKLKSKANSYPKPNIFTPLNQADSFVDLFVPWQDLFFEDGSIKIRLDKRRFVRHPFYQSRTSYEYVKAYLVRKEIEPLKVQISNGRVRSITNLDLLNDAIQILKIHTEWNKILAKDNNIVNASSIVESLGKLRPKAFDFFYRNKDLTPYLKELCQIQELHYHLIPVLEPSSTKNTFPIEKESFLFTIRRKASIYIVWESVEANKATFVFKTNQEDYYVDLQKIFDYISAHLNNKRTNLRKGIMHNEGQYIQSYQTFYHTTLEKWKTKIFECFI